MKPPSKVRSRIYASIAGVGLAAVAYWLGTIHGATKALDQFRNLSFAATDSALRRELRFDSLLADGNVDGARRSALGAAIAHYQSLAEEASGARQPPTEWMSSAFVESHRWVSEYCATPAAAFHASTETNLCGSLARTAPSAQP